MTRLVHLTDLHFGLHRDALVAPLVRAVQAVDPDVVVVSGDLTQRALRSQFAAAMTFVRGLDKPFLLVAGNHDLPAYNLLRRVFDPFGPFRRGALPDLMPTLHIGRLRVFGINTAAPWLWRGGVARSRQIDAVCQAVEAGSGDTTNIVVSHHPLEEPPGFNRNETRGASAALARLGQAGVHAVLSGHLHHWSLGLGITATAARPVFQMQTGTALCARPHERAHGFAVMDFADKALRAALWQVDEATLRYCPQEDVAFDRRAGGWLRH